MSFILSTPSRRLGCFIRRFFGRRDSVVRVLLGMEMSMECYHETNPLRKILRCQSPQLKRPHSFIMRAVHDRRNLKRIVSRLGDQDVT